MQETKEEKLTKRTPYLGRDAKGFRVIAAYVENGQSVFWCEYCNRNHYHSVGKGQRLCHCILDKTPLRKHGYVLEIVSKEEALRLTEGKRREE